MALVRLVEDAITSTIQAINYPAIKMQPLFFVCDYGELSKYKP